MTYLDALREESRRNIERQERLAMTATDYAFYNAQLAHMRGEGLAPEVTPGTPHAGFYRRGTRKAGEWVCVAIWRDAATGNLVALDGEWSVTDPDRLDDLFARCCRQAVPEAVWRGVAERGEPWPDTPPPPAVDPQDFANMPSDPHAALTAQIEAERMEVERWLKATEIASEEDAAKATDWAHRIKTQLQDVAEETRVAEKRPHDEAAKAVQTKWRPLVDTADSLVRKLKAATEPYLREKQRRLAAERAAALAAEEPVAAPPQRLAVGNAGRVSLRTVKTAVIEDIEQAVAFFLKEEATRVEIERLVQAMATKVVRVGGQVPGVRVKVDQKAA